MFLLIVDYCLIVNSVGGVVNLPSVSALMLLAATAEQCSEHPIAVAIMKNAREVQKVTPMPLAENAAVSFVGSGVSCESPLGRILVGNRTFMKTQEVDFSAVADSAMWTLETQGKVSCSNQCFLLFICCLINDLCVNLDCNMHRSGQQHSGSGGRGRRAETRSRADYSIASATWPGRVDVDG
jgi:hypothetical protein